MMKFWTFQTASRVDALRAGKPVFPRWDTRGYRAVGSSMEAYQYLLGQFNRKNGMDAKGLVFGYAQPSENAVSGAILKEGTPSGSYFSATTHRLLELEVPVGAAAIVVDFYRFSDLLYACGEEDDLPLDVAERDLLLPNGKTWKLPVTHIEGIRLEWILAEHIPREI